MTKSDIIVMALRVCGAQRKVDAARQLFHRAVSELGPDDVSAAVFDTFLTLLAQQSSISRREVQYVLTLLDGSSGGASDNKSTTTKTSTRTERRGGDSPSASTTTTTTTTRRRRTAHTYLALSEIYLRLYEDCAPLWWTMRRQDSHITPTPAVLRLLIHGCVLPSASSSSSSSCLLYTSPSPRDRG